MTQVIIKKKQKHTMKNIKKSCKNMDEISIESFQKKKQARSKYGQNGYLKFSKILNAKK